MQIAIITPGSRGDVQPYVALGKGLQKAGHAVGVVTHPPFEKFARGEGLDFASLGGDPRALVAAHFQEGASKPPVWLPKGVIAMRDALRSARGLQEALMQGMQEMTEQRARLAARRFAAGLSVCWASAGLRRFWQYD
jgi:hypothetical protein